MSRPSTLCGGRGEVELGEDGAQRTAKDRNRWGAGEVIRPSTFYAAMSITRMGMLTMENTVVTKVPCAMVRESPPYW